MKKLITVFCLLVVVQLTAQNKIGVRAGLNYSTFKEGPLEIGEDYGVSGGFHFGINYTYMIQPKLGIRAELLYLQRGTSYNFADTTEGVYNIITPLDRTIPTFVEIGRKEENIVISNGYISLPITAQYQLTKKWEIFAGASFDLLLNPTGRGQMEFRSLSRPGDITYRQSYSHKYRGDEAGEIPIFANQVTTILLNERPVNLIRTKTAYYNLTPEQKVGNKFNLVDVHLIFGVNYFLNNGFYIGLRGHLGLFDVTNDDMDFSMRSLDENNNYITRSDKDLSRSLSVSFGFRF